MNSNEIDIYLRVLDEELEKRPIRKPVRIVVVSPNLQIYVPQADCMLALKLLAGCERDTEDIAALCAQLAI